MAAAGTERTLEETPTWAVAVVCFVLLFISIILEHVLHLVGKWLTRKHKQGLYEAFEKIKSELMLLGFISLLLTVGQGPISNICISKTVGATWHPCSKKQEEDRGYETSYKRRLLGLAADDESEYGRRVLASAKDDKCAAKGMVPFVSTYGIHQLHIFIFVLAVFHVLYCIITLALGRLKMRSWKTWEMETRTVDFQFMNDPERFRFARETSFGRRHMNFWSNSSILLWIVCFFRQFFRSVPKVDYLTLRHGFITAHLAPQSHTTFDFQKYINRSLEKDFKAVVGINPVIWFLAVVFLLFNTHGWYSYLWLPFLPLIVVLLIGTKLQVIITKMGLTIQERGGVIKGTPVVKPGDEHFWFNNPHLILYLINFVLFQNAFQLAFFAWTWYEFGLKSCFHERLEDVLIRVTMGVLVQILCSYVTLPLYALVTQMGSTMRPTIFNEKVATALRSWHHTAKKQIKQSHHSGTVTPVTSRPGTPLHGTTPLHLLQHYQNGNDSFPTSPWLNEDSASHHDDVSWAQHRGSDEPEEEDREIGEESSTQNASLHQNSQFQHEINIHSTNFSFGKRPRT